RATRAQGGVAVRDAGQARGLPRAHRLSGLRDQPRAVSLAVAELGGAADACGASVSGESGQWLAVSALRARSKGYAVSRLRPGDAGAGRGRETDEHPLAAGGALAESLVQGIQHLARRVGVLSARRLAPPRSKLKLKEPATGASHEHNPARHFRPCQRRL